MSVPAQRFLPRTQADRKLKSPTPAAKAKRPLRPRTRRGARIAYQGEPGANSHTGLPEVFPDLEPMACPTFEDALAAVKSGRCPLRHDPDRELAGRPRGRHPPPAARFRAVHRRRALPADPPPADGASGRVAADGITRCRQPRHALGQCRKHHPQARAPADRRQATRRARRAIVAEADDPSRRGHRPEACGRDLWA